MKDYDLYIFDFDGTLADTADSLVPVFQRGFAAIGINDISDEEARDFMHHDLRTVADSKGVKVSQHALFLAAILKALDDEDTMAMIRPFDDGIEIVKALKKQGKRLAIVSGNSSEHIKKVLAIHHLSDYFDCIVGSDMYKKSKPHGEPLEVCMGMLGFTDKSKIIYFGDSEQDALAALDAGMDYFIVDRNQAYEGKWFLHDNSLLDFLKKE